MGTPCAKFCCCYLADLGLDLTYVQVSRCRDVGIARIGATNRALRTSLLGGREPFLCLALNLAFIGRRKFGIRQGNARKGSVPFMNDGHFSKWDSQKLCEQSRALLVLVVRGRTRGETRVRRWSYERLSRDPPLHIRSSRSQTSGALCAQMSPPSSYRKVHTKINVSCTAGPIACSSNDSARDPAGTTFFFGRKVPSRVPSYLQGFPRHGNRKLPQSLTALETFVFSRWRPWSGASHQL
jgi:hypothetical protein